MRAGDKERPVILSLLPTLIEGDVMRISTPALMRVPVCAFRNEIIHRHLLFLPLLLRPAIDRGSRLPRSYATDDHIVNDFCEVLRTVREILQQRSVLIEWSLNRLSVDGNTKSHGTRPGWAGQTFESGHTAKPVQLPGWSNVLCSDGSSRSSHPSPLFQPAPPTSCFFPRFKPTPVSLSVLYQLLHAACRPLGLVALPPLEHPVGQTSNMSVQQR